MPNKKIPVFRVTQPYLNLLVNLEFFSGFLEKYNFMHFARHFCLSKCIKLLFFPEKKNVCLPYLKFSDPLPETHLFFYLGLVYKGLTIFGKSV